MEKRPTSGESGQLNASEVDRSNPGSAAPTAPDPTKFAVKSDFGSGFVPDPRLTGGIAPAAQERGKYDLQLGKETTILYIGRKVRRA